MSDPNSSQFTFEDVRHAADFLGPLDKAQLLSTLGTMAAEKSQLMEELTRKNLIENFAMCLERCGPEGNTANIEQWTEDLAYAAIDVLEEFTKAKPVTEGEDQTRKVASYVYVLISGRYEDSPAVIESAGLSLDGVMGEVKQALRTSLADLIAGNPVFRGRLNAVNGIAELQDFINIVTPDMYEVLLNASGHQMRNTLIEEGYILPELRSDGIYETEIPS